MHEDAIAMLKKVCAITNRSPFFVSYLGLALAQSGNMPAAKEVLDEVQQSQQHVAPAIFARLWMGFGDWNRMFEAWHRAVDEMNVVLFLFAAPEIDPIRTDPRYQELMQRLTR
jgi:hypothetical protein